MFLRRFLRPVIVTRGAIGATATAGFLGSDEKSSPVLLGGGGLIPKNELVALQSANAKQEQYRTRYLSAAYLQCVRHFNHTQMNSKTLVKEVRCIPMLNLAETEALIATLKEAGYHDYVVKTVDECPHREISRTEIVWMPPPEGNAHRGLFD